MPQKLCLQWNDFQEDVTRAFGSLREDTDFADVTLVSEDGEQLKAHKVILAASSPFFEIVLKKNRHPHPLIYMRGMKSEDLMAIVDFLYFGEANIYQENLESFLGIAEELQLKGMKEEKTLKEEETLKEKPKKMAQNSTKIPICKKERNSPKISEPFHHITVSKDPDALKSLVLEDLKELDQKTNAMMEKTSTINTNGKALCRFI